MGGTIHELLVCGISLLKPLEFGELIGLAEIKGSTEDLA
jgi:hypothetical protein